MTEKKIEENSPVLTFEGRKYNVNDLSNEIKEIIKSLQIADTQVKMHEDTLKLITIGRNTLAKELKNKLNSLD